MNTDKTHTPITTARGTALRSLSSPLSLTFRSLQMFLQKLQPSLTLSGYWNRSGCFGAKSGHNTLQDFFDGFGSPRKRRKELHPFVQKVCSSCEEMAIRIRHLNANYNSICQPLTAARGEYSEFLDSVPKIHGEAGSIDDRIEVPVPHSRHHCLVPTPRRS
ncbi:hypothetical protein AVEN_219309-1 [Araneus ventricosus]|uniref:Uncharacterized protein n=1 Tax=Araneus ventricosus TaxID=182803 RepID=A0A4Y2BGF7_ARAVE|nr:hypothetical protein AVEN_219309-1 [Araneus ventricosus]